MIDEKIDSDISDDEFDKVHGPYNENLNNFLIRYIVPEVFAFQLAQSYYRNCLCASSLEAHYNSMTDIILVYPSLDDIKAETINLLKIKYNLQITNENPTVLEKWQ
ncbi:MAG: hypothetical protein PHO63_05585 [Bacilli bacterium]|nr:hypothetical protein [Bacilli bacterium]MDD4809239.1 hypothetical protein [Bacilli bacterium]